MAIEISITHSEVPSKICCEAGSAAHEDYKQAVYFETSSDADMDAEVIDYRQRRSIIASHCGRLGTQRCLLEDQCMLDRFPQPDNN